MIDGVVLSLPGLTPYQEGLALQERLVEGRIEGRRRDTLILLEHPHVVTVGRGFNGHTLGPTPHPVFHVDRGGDVTYHGPGQIVGYPIVHLGERDIKIGPYLRSLEDVLIRALSAFGLRGERLKGFTGVWCAGKKIASIGIGVRGWVAYHGFALNVAPDLAQFKGIHPCGLEPEAMTSLEALQGTTPDPASVRAAVSEAFRMRFQGHA